MHHIILGLLLTCATLQAITVAKASKNAMAIGSDPEKAYTLNEAVCAVRGDLKIACGRIAKITDNGAIVRLSVVKGQVEIGDEVIRMGERKTASKSQMKESMKRIEIAPKNALGGGIIGGTGGGASYVFAVMSYERTLSQKFSFRFEPTYFVAPGDGFTITALGAKIGLSYDSIEAFKGAWASVGVGYYSMVMETNGTKTHASVPVGTGLLGYRFRLGKIISLALGVGAQYLPLTDLNLLTPPSNVLPVGMGALAFVF